MQMEEHHSGKQVDQPRQYKGKDIVQSVKVASWNSGFNQDQAKMYFEKYANGNPNNFEPNASGLTEKVFPTEESQVKSIATGFKKLKLDQIEKLKDLRQQYENLRNLTADPLRQDQLNDLNSSSHSQAVASQHPPRQKPERQLQILLLEKRQLEIMIEKSMKKVEQLLHNEAQYKKTIHELRLQLQAKNSNNNIDSEQTVRQLQKKERQLLQNLTQLQSERTHQQTLTVGATERTKYLEGSLANCQLHIKRLVEEKRHAEEIMRMEKDKYAVLEIEQRRTRKELQIMLKHKEAEISELTTQLEEREGSIQRQLRREIALLQDDVKDRQKRYALLLEQMENFTVEREKKEKEASQKLVAAMKALTANDPALAKAQEHMKALLERISQLEKKLAQSEMDKGNSSNHVVSQLQLSSKAYANEVETLKRQLEKVLSEQLASETQLRQTRETLNAQIEKTRQVEANLGQLTSERNAKDKQYKAQRENLQDMEKELQKLKRENNRLKQNLESTQLNSPRNPPRFEESVVQRTPAFGQSESQKVIITTNNAELDKARKQLEKLDEENRSLLKMNYEVNFQKITVAKEMEFKIAMMTQQHQREKGQLVRQVNELKDKLNQVRGQVSQAKGELASAQKQLQLLRVRLDSNTRQSRSASQEPFNMQAVQTNSQQEKQIQQLRAHISTMHVSQDKMASQLRKHSQTVQENLELRQRLKQCWHLNSELEHLWQVRDQELQNVTAILGQLLPNNHLRAGSH